MSSPPSLSPRTPDWIHEEREEQARKRKEQILEMQSFIGLTMNLNLKKFAKEDPLIAFFSTLITSNMLIDKRYKIAQAINGLIKEQNLDNQEVRATILEQFKEDIFDKESPLYSALNFQRNSPFSITFFGAMTFIGCNFSRSLQAAQDIIQKEQKQMARIKQ